MILFLNHVERHGKQECHVEIHPQIPEVVLQGDCCLY